MIESLFNSYLPASTAIITTILLLLGIIYFVFPIMKKYDNLIKNHDELRDKYDGLVEHLKNTRPSQETGIIEDDGLEKIKEELDLNADIYLDTLSEIKKILKEEHSEINNDKIENLVSGLENVISKIENKEVDQKIKIELIEIKKNIEEVSQEFKDILNSNNNKLVNLQKDISILQNQLNYLEDSLLNQILNKSYTKYNLK